MCNEKKTPTLVISTDASNFYDRVAYPFACLIAQHFGLHLQHLLLLLKTTQSMNVFLQTAYGTSPSTYSIPRPRILQGPMQGNGAAPVLWIMMSIILIKYLYLKCLYAPQYSPMSQMIFIMIALMCVDDTHLNVLNAEGKSKLEVIEAGQRTLDACQFVLSVFGGDLKLEKCSWTLKDYYCIEGKCLPTLHNPYLLNVTSNSTQHPLEYTPPNETRTLVGATVNPANETKQIISLFQDKVSALTTTLNSLHMSPCDTLLRHKFY